MAKNNANLHNAKTAKNDEFYTRLEDINAEMRFYTEYFRGKTVMCNCDDPLVSNFVIYFGLNFHHLGLKRLIATCFKNEDPTRFSFGSKKNAHGTVLDYHGEVGAEEVADGFVEKLIPYTKPMKGNGDFRSEESLALLKEADIVVTNPPFSLFREYIATMEGYGKNYIVVGPQNAVTYKEIFPLIKNGNLWLGTDCIRWFVMPNETTKVTKSDYDGKRIAEGDRSRWFTNLDHKKRHEGIYLVKKYNPEIYPKYDNYNAIEVSKTADIPMDYDGVMGVPITFLDKFNPEQFEIVGGYGYSIDTDGKPLNCRINGKYVYKRILIRRRPEWNQDEHF